MTNAQRGQPVTYADPDNSENQSGAGRLALSSHRRSTPAAREVTPRRSRNASRRGPPIRATAPRWARMWLSGQSCLPRVRTQCQCVGATSVVSPSAPPAALGGSRSLQRATASSRTASSRCLRAVRQYGRHRRPPLSTRMWPVGLVWSHAHESRRSGWSRPMPRSVAVPRSISGCGAAALLDSHARTEIAPLDSKIARWI
jgi:hypothetical protein